MDNDLNDRFESGKLPAWAYYQLNGKSAQENYNAQKRARRKKKDQKPLDDTIALMKAMIAEFVKQAIDEILRDMKKNK